MFSFILGLIIGCIAAALLFALCAPFAWRRALFLARKAVRSELPLSLKEIEADRDFLRARQAVDICRLQQELEEERSADHSRKLALSRGREQLSRGRQLEEECAAQAKQLAAQEKKIEALSARNRVLKAKAEASLKLKAADLTLFRKQMKQIAAQTAGFIAAAEGSESPVLQLVNAEEMPAPGVRGENGRARGESLAEAIKQAALKAAAAKKQAAKRETKPAAKPAAAKRA